MSATPLAASLLILLGSSSNQKGAARGIWTTQLDPATGAFTPPALVAETPNPGWLATHPRTHFIYASGEAGRIDEKSVAGAVNAYALNADGPLANLGQQPNGTLPVTHCAIDATGRMLVAVSYHGGKVVSFPVGPDGQLGPLATSLPTTGTLGPNTGRQDKAHPHSVTISPDNRFAYVCDLGFDRVFRYRLDPKTATISLAGATIVPAGSGPRHSKFSADGRFLYVVNELANTVCVFACDATSGELALKQTIGTLPAGFTGYSISSEVRLHPNGRYVYTGNRGYDSIAVFARDEQAGTLERVEVVPCGGKTPRNFGLSADGQWLVSANLDSGTLTSFRIDPATGRLTATGQSAAVPVPTCVLFVP